MTEQERRTTSQPHAFTDPEVMHEVIADQLKEVKNYAGEFSEFFRPDKDAKINPGGSVTLRFRYVILDDKTLVSIKELFGVDGLTCVFMKR